MVFPESFMGFIAACTETLRRRGRGEYIRLEIGFLPFNCVYLYKACSWNYEIKDWHVYGGYSTEKAFCRLHK